MGGWRENRFAHDPRWEVRDGVLIGRRGQGYLVTEQSFTDFQRVAVVRISDSGGARGKSGIYLRCQPHQNRETDYPPGHEVQCDHADRNNPTGSIHNLGVRGARAPMPRLENGEWVTLRAVVRGNHLQTWVNGEPGAHCRDPQNRFRSGTILLQMHHRTGIVEFQQVRVKPLTQP